METRSLTPRQLLILVLTACRDSGYEVIPRQKLMDAFWDLRTIKCSSAPDLKFVERGERRFCRELEQAFSGLHASGAAYHALEKTVTISDELTCAEIYKPLHDEEREKLADSVAPYIAEFVQRVSRLLPGERVRPDPRLS